MTKRTRLASANTPEKDEILEDWVNRLPDDILINIISRLPLKEAARTSVISRRWKCLWSFTTSLNFDVPESLLSVANLEEERSKYINWVDRVLESHQGSYINDFRVCFDLCNSQKSEITNWIYTALAKKVQNVELDLWPGRYQYGNYYEFLQDCCLSLKGVCGLSSIKSLRSLCFNSVNVNGEILEFFMQNCPFLDRLCVDRSRNLLSLKVVGSSIQLKYLEIQSCSFMKEIEISAPRLLSFIYYGPEIKLRIEDVPQLVDVSIRGNYIFQVKYSICPSISCLPQLKTLELDSCNEVYTQFQMCEFPNLIHLKLRILTPNRESLLGLTCIMKACPFLQKLILQVDDHGRKLGKKRHQFPKYSHQHLKVVELHGFLGRQFDLEFAFYLLQNAIMLEKLIVEPSSYMRKKTLRKCVKMLEAKLPKAVELVVGSLYSSDLN